MLQSKIVSVVGSDQVNPESNLGQILSSIFTRLAILGLTLRTSGTDGTELIAIQAYKKQLDMGVITPSRVRVFLPWRGYNKTLQPYGECYTTISKLNYDLCSNFIRSVHPYWASGTKNMKLLQAKNALIIFGEKLNRPCDFLITVTEKDPQGKIKGVPSSAVELAKVRNIPIFDLAEDDTLDDTLFELRTYLRKVGYPIVAEEEVVI